MSLVVFFGQKKKVEDGEKAERAGPSCKDYVQKRRFGDEPKFLFLFLFHDSIGWRGYLSYLMMQKHTYGS